MTEVLIAGERLCDRCNGTGFDGHGETCFRCGGTDRIASAARRRVQLQDDVLDAARAFVRAYRADEFFFAPVHNPEAGVDAALVERIGDLAAAVEGLVDAVEELDR